MSVYRLKSEFQNQLRPISDKLVRYGVTANQITISAVVLSVGTAYVIIGSKPNQGQQARWLILPSTLFVRMALNAIDGMMAREHGQASRLGAVLNEAGDIISDSVLIHSLHPHLTSSTTSSLSKSSLISQSSIIPHTSTIRLLPHSKQKFSKQSHLTCVANLATLTELIAIIANQSTGMRANHGPLGKSDRALELGLIGLCVAAGIGKPLYEQAKPLLVINQLLLIKTCFNRLSFIATH